MCNYITADGVRTAFAIVNSMSKRERWREETIPDQLLAEPEQEDAIHIKDGHGNTADCGTTDDGRPIPAQVAAPTVPTRIEERRQLLRPSVTAGNIRPLIRIAMEATQSQVPRYCGAVMLYGDHVIDLEWRRIISLRHQAVFAAAFGTTSHQFDERLVHGTSPQNYLLAAFLRARRALA